MTPSLVQVTAGGEALAGFNYPGPASHFKLVLPATGQRGIDLPEPGDDGLMLIDRTTPLIMRTYTARRFDRRTGELAIELVLHGDGPAAQWTANVTAGDQIAVSSPRACGFTLPTDSRWLLLAGDTSAMPAIATILESLPEVPTTCLIEISDHSEALDLPAGGRCDVEWILRDQVASPGSALLHRLRSSGCPSRSGFVWIAGEAASIRQVRRYLLTECGLGSHQVVTRGCWRAGATNHPDHDFGDDQLGS